MLEGDVNGGGVTREELRADVKKCLARGFFCVVVIIFFGLLIHYVSKEGEGGAKWESTTAKVVKSNATLESATTEPIKIVNGETEAIPYVETIFVTTEEATESTTMATTTTTTSTTMSTTTARWTVLGSDDTFVHTAATATNRKVPVNTQDCGYLLAKSYSQKKRSPRSVLATDDSKQDSIEPDANESGYLASKIQYLSSCAKGRNITERLFHSEDEYGIEARLSFKVMLPDLLSKKFKNASLYLVPSSISAASNLQLYNITGDTGDGKEMKADLRQFVKVDKSGIHQVDISNYALAISRDIANSKQFSRPNKIVYLHVTLRCVFKKNVSGCSTFPILNSNVYDPNLKIFFN